MTTGRSTGIACAVLIAAVAVAAALPAAAQQVYKSVGPQGRVTYSDTPPVDGAGAAVSSAATVPGIGNPALPFELRQVALRYPVTVYTGPQCEPCSSARALLTSRGIPFSERTVTSNEDIEALGRIVGAPTLPSISVGGQALRGYSDADWSRLLDAAGYPSTSALPASWRAEPATPLVAVLPAQPVKRPVAEPPKPEAPPVPRPPASSASNPAGIRF